MWILDDVTPLHQVDRVRRRRAPRCSSSRAKRFARASAADAAGSAAARGGGASSGQAQFPPNGASINYYLSHAPSDRVTIDILDSSGKSIRSYSSEATSTQRGRGAGGGTDDEEGGTASDVPRRRFG